MKNLIVVTGGTGFVGTNLIKFLLEKTSYKIISLDDYSSGSKNNHINNKLPENTIICQKDSFLAAAQDIRHRGC